MTIFIFPNSDPFCELQNIDCCLINLVLKILSSN